MDHYSRACVFCDLALTPHLGCIRVVGRNGYLDFALRGEELGVHYWSCGIGEVDRTDRRNAIGETAQPGRLQRRDRAVKKLVMWGALLLLILAVTSCATQATYLRAAVERASQEGVAAHLGPPQEVWALTTGETLWTYRYDERLWAYRDGSGSSQRPAGLSIVGPGLTVLPGARCTEYVLRFDRDQVLRAWRRQPCKAAADATRKRPPSQP